MPSPGTVTLLSVRNQAKYRADMVSSSFVADAEWNSYIANSYKELYDLLISAYGNDYSVATPATFQTDGTNDKYALPDGTLYSAAPAFYKLLGVDLQVQGGQIWQTLKPFNFAERNRYAPYGVQSLYRNTAIRYRLTGSNIWFTPLPQSGLTIQLWYIPEPTTLSADTDTFDGVSGWEEYVIIDAAIKALQKEESDVSVLMAQKQAMISRIQAMAENRDAGSPATVVDSMGMAGGYMSPFNDPWGDM
jgi:hypothetical protein